MGAVQCNELIVYIHPLLQYILDSQRRKYDVLKQWRCLQ